MIPSRHIITNRGVAKSNYKQAGRFIIITQVLSPSYSLVFSESMMSSSLFWLGQRNDSVQH